MKLVSASAEVTVDLKAGGRLSSFRLHGEEILVSSPSDPFGWGCYPMVPWAGRIRDGKFDWEGREIALPVNMEPHAIHGTLYNSPWTQVEDMAAQSHFAAPWAFSGYAKSRFELGDNHFIWVLEVHTESENMPCVVGWHPWFLRDQNIRSDDAFSFSPETMYERDESGIPTGQKSKPSPRPWDDCFENDRGPINLRCAGDQRLEISSDCSHWVIYDEPEHAFCIEPQSAPPNGFNLGAFTVVTPERPLIRKMIWRW